MTEQLQAIAEIIAAVPGATVEISEGSIKISGLNTLSKGTEEPAEKKRRAKKLPKPITPDQYAKLAKTVIDKYPTGENRRIITDLRNRVILEIMYRAALRVQEVCNLSPADIDFERKTIYVQEGKNLKDRVVPFGAELGVWLKKWLNARPQKGNYFFCTAQGKQLSTRYVRAMLERVSLQAEVYIQDGKQLRAVNPHALRHSCATNWLNDGLTIREVQELLGHESVETTMLYTHVSMSHLGNKIEALG